MTSARVIPLLAAPLASGPPLWLNDDATVARAVDAKRTPPTWEFWRRFGELTQIGFAIVHGRVSGHCLFHAIELIDDLAAELALGVRPQTPSRLARSDQAAGAADLRLTDGCGHRSPLTATDERANTHTRLRGGIRPRSVLDSAPHGWLATRLAVDTARLAHVLADPCPAAPSDVALRVDNFGVSLRDIFRRDTNRPTRTTLAVADSHAGHDPPLTP